MTQQQERTVRRIAKLQPSATRCPECSGDLGCEDGGAGRLAAHFNRVILRCYVNPAHRYSVAVTQN